VRGQEHADGLLRAAVALVVAESPPCVEHRAVDRDREHEPVEPGRALRHSPEPREPADLGKHNPPKGEQSRLTSDTDQRSSEAEQRALEIVRLFELDDRHRRARRPHHGLGEQLLPDGRESAGGSAETAELDEVRARDSIGGGQTLASA
jgi:hypothetical protein